LDTRQAVTNIIKAFTTFVLKTGMRDVLASGNGDSLANRLRVFNTTRTNVGVLAIDKDLEDFLSVSAPIAGLEGIEAKAQEQMASISQIPLVKLTGISPSGLNASGETEMECWEDRVLAFQEAFLRPNLERVIRFIQLSKFGDADPSIRFSFVPLSEMTELEKAELRKIDAETGEVLVRSKAISSQEERERISRDHTGPYSSIKEGADVEYPMTEVEKAQVTQSISAAISSLFGDGIIDAASALREIKAYSVSTGFGTTITEEDIKKAALEPPMPGEEDGSEDDTKMVGEERSAAPSTTKGVRAEA
jgi:hypothetical protein